MRVRSRTMDWLDQAEERSLRVIREALGTFSRPAVLWSVGKDSTCLLWMCRKAFLGGIPFPVLHVDTGRKFAGMYAFRDRLTTAWGLDLRVIVNEAARARGVSPETHDVEACCHALKTQAMTGAIDSHGFDAVLLGIRRDEHGVRAKERYFSPRDGLSLWQATDQPAEPWDLPAAPPDAEGHVRVHPLLHMTELDVWRYTAREGIPVNPLYFARDGWRYRSLGCEPCCMPVQSHAEDVPGIIAELETLRTAERAGRAQDKESPLVMQKLRSLGYM